MNTSNSTNSVAATDAPTVEESQVGGQTGKGSTQTPGQNPMAGGMDENMWATLAHAGTFVGVVVPFGNIIVPLAIMLLKKEESAYIAEHAKESLNFQISLSIYFIVAAILMLVLIGVLLAGVLAILWIIFVIKASQAAHTGQSYRYPMTIRLVK